MKLRKIHQAIPIKINTLTVIEAIIPESPGNFV